MAKGQLRDGKREAFWRAAVARQRSSGLNVRQWCAGERLPETAFYFWRRTLAQRDRSTAGASVPGRRRSPQAGFVPVILTTPLSTPQATPVREHRIVIRLRGGRVMRLPVGMEARQVAELVHAIEGEPALSLPAVSLPNPPKGSASPSAARGEGVAS